MKMHLKIIEDGKAMGVLMCYLVHSRREFFFCNASSQKDEMRYACALSDGALLIYANTQKIKLVFLKKPQNAFKIIPLALTHGHENHDATRNPTNGGFAFGKRTFIPQTLCRTGYFA